MRRLTSHLFVALLSTTIIVSCGEAPDKGKTAGTQEEEPVFKPKEGVYKAKRKENITKIFHAIPSPMEMATLIKKTGAEFDKDVLNSPDNAENYLTSTNRAINLGIYGADLSYTSMFERDKESLYYFDAVTELARSLDVEAAIESGLLQRVKDNKNNQDSLMSIITETYWTINAYLKENESREETSALVIAGGWMEGLHLAGSHYEAGNEDLRERIAEQKYALNNLIDLMDSYKSSALNGLTADLKEVKELYADVEITKGKTEKTKDSSGMVVLGGKREVSMNDVTLRSVLSKIKEIRNKYIS